MINRRLSANYARSVRADHGTWQLGHHVLTECSMLA